MTSSNQLLAERRIPFNRAGVEGGEIGAMTAALRSGHTASGGPFSQRAAQILQDGSGARDVLLTTSCTSALELSALLLDVGPSDTVIVPSFTFTTTALAFARQGARLLFCDIEPHTLGLDPHHLAELLDDTVTAVVPVHYAGVACDVEGMHKALADAPDVAVVEDNAHGLFGRWHDRPLGSVGRMATLSFHETKNIVCGEGGALLLNDEQDVDRARVLYEKGTDRRAFMLGQVDKYSWKDTGSSFAMSDVLAAYLFAQLEKREVIQAKRANVFRRYADALEPVADELGIRLPVVPDHCVPAYHMFYVLLPTRSVRDAVLAAMRSDGVTATFHYVPLHSSEAGRRFARRWTDCPVTDDISGRLLRLPFYNDLTEADQARVVDSLVHAVRATANGSS